MSDPIGDLRAVVAAASPAAPIFSTYIEKVSTRAYTVTDADVAALIAAGLAEDEIFEQTVAAAIAQGLRRLDAAEAAIG